jgi:molybdate transport system substrate-binding protein
MGEPVVEHITGISSMAMREVLTELAEAYERRSGRQVTVESVGGIDAARRVSDGEAFDFVVLASRAIEGLAAAGRVDGRTRIDLARSRIAIAIRAGASRPDVASESSIREAVLRARTVGYSTGPSGAHVARLFERWAIADAIAPRLVQAPPGVPVGSLVAKGVVELAFQQLGELMHISGVEVLGVLPQEIQEITVFSAAVCSTSHQRTAARALLSFLASPEADAPLSRHGMEPARSSGHAARDSRENISP